MPLPIIRSPSNAWSAAAWSIRSSAKPMWISTQSPGATAGSISMPEVDRPLRAEYVYQRDLPRVTVQHPDDLAGDSQAHAGHTAMSFAQQAFEHRCRGLTADTAADDASDSPMPSATLAGRQPTTIGRVAALPPSLPDAGQHRDRRHAMRVEIAAAQIVRPHLEHGQLAGRPGPGHRIHQHQ